MSDMISIQPYKVSLQGIKNPKCMGQLGLKHPFNLFCCGVPSSGKTVAIINLFTQAKCFRGYFDNIYAFGPTVESDETFKHLKLPKEKLISHNMEERLTELLAKMKADVIKNGLKKSKKSAIIFEDMTSQRKLQNTKSFRNAFTAYRHYNLSCICIVHKFNAFERTCRVATRHIILFPCTMSEKKIVSAEFQTPEFTKSDFLKMMDRAFEKEEGMERPFLHINSAGDTKDRFRKSFKKILLPDNKFKFIFEEDAQEFYKKRIKGGKKNKKGDN